MDKDAKIASQINKLEEKFKNSGQDLSSYLDGLLYERYLTYWDYIRLDTLLSLQVPRTHFPDEEIFIMYHQITELYFKLILHEEKQIVEDKSQDVTFFIEKVRRINSYFKALISSFSIMIKGMEREQFLRYRMALLPASGFQSVQYRMIEFYATPLENMVHASERDSFSSENTVEELFEHIYWKKGATDLATGEKTLTLKQFEVRYTPRLLRIANQVKDSTIYQKYLQLPDASRHNEELISALKELDLNANVNWPLMHMGSAHRYLAREGDDVEATGGTNWKKYLPPSFQKIIFFPTLHTKEELDTWGKQWVDHVFNPEKKNTRNRRREMQKIIGAILMLAVLASCKQTKEPVEEIAKVEVIEKLPVLRYGFNFDEFNVVHDTVRNGDSFGELMLKNKVDYPKIAAISENYRDTFDVRKIMVGKPYLILKSKDTSEVAEVFIYQNDKINYTVVDLRDSTKAYKSKKQVKLVEREIGGVIDHSLSMSIDTLGVDYNLTFALSDIYAWTIDFGRLDKGDKFKVIFDERYINDSIYAGIGSIKAAYFEHKGKTIYAFPYISDATNHILEYFDQDANNLRSTFLRAPIKFKYRLSSRYNLRRRIAYYGNKVRPHRGTDFAAKIGTPIVATADGTVTESTRRGGNGKYVKIKHNGTYSTQYLHMKAQNVKRGDFVRQGDVIGWIGMTGNTGGPHVCYRFWKNGRQVDPFKEELPAAEPIADSLRADYLAYIQPLQDQLDCIELVEPTPLESEETLISYTQ